ELFDARDQLVPGQLAVLVAVQRLQQQLRPEDAHPEATWRTARTTRTAREGRRRHQQVNGGRKGGLIERALLVLVDLLEQGLGASDQFVERPLAVLVGVGTLDDGARQRRPLTATRTSRTAAAGAARTTRTATARRLREDAVESLGQLLLVELARL